MQVPSYFQELIDIMDRLKIPAESFGEGLSDNWNLNPMGEVVKIIPGQGWRLQWMFYDSTVQQDASLIPLHVIDPANLRKF